MFNRLVLALIVIPIAIVLIALSVANRGPATFSYDPFASGNPALNITLPLFILLFGAFIAGLLIGGAATWFSQRKYRKAMRRSEANAGAVKAQGPGVATPPAGLPALTR